MLEPVVVLGMHRSGTSFLIRALNLSGLWLGEESQLSTVEGRAMIGNPKGNYENRNGIAINDAILTRSGGAWFKPPQALTKDATDIPRIREFCGVLQRGRPPQFPRWGWKDPRTVLTLDVWLRALDRPIFIVASFRHPTSVARSLLARDKIPLGLGYALWTYYNSLLLGYLARFPHVLVRFDVAQDALIRQIGCVCELTGLRVDHAALEAWHDPELVRSKIESEDSLGPPNAAEIWNRLLRLHEAQSHPISKR